MLPREQIQLILHRLHHQAYEYVNRELLLAVDIALALTHDSTDETILAMIDQHMEDSPWLEELRK